MEISFWDLNEGTVLSKRTVPCAGSVGIMSLLLMAIFWVANPERLAYCSRRGGEGPIVIRINPIREENVCIRSHILKKLRRTLPAILLSMFHPRARQSP